MGLDTYINKKLLIRNGGPLKKALRFGKYDRMKMFKNNIVWVLGLLLLMSSCSGEKYVEGPVIQVQFWGDIEAGQWIKWTV